MKMLLALVCMLGIAAAGYGQPAPTSLASADAESSKAAPSQSQKAPVRIVLPPKTDDKQPSAKKAGTAKKKEPEKKKEEEPKINGVVVPRGERGFLGVEIVGAQFKITFYDTKKKPTQPDVARAVLRWDPKYKVGQDRLVLNPDADGKSLSSPRSVRPPYNFKLFITLIKEPAENVDPSGETHVIDFRA
jgi:hypothetical protein